MPPVVNTATARSIIVVFIEFSLVVIKNHSGEITVPFFTAAAGKVYLSLHQAMLPLIINSRCVLNEKNELNS